MAGFVSDGTTSRFCVSAITARTPPEAPWSTVRTAVSSGPQEASTLARRPRRLQALLPGALGAAVKNIVNSLSGTAFFIISPRTDDPQQVNPSDNGP